MHGYYKKFISYIKHAQRRDNKFLSLRNIVIWFLYGVDLALVIGSMLLVFVFLNPQVDINSVLPINLIVFLFFTLFTWIILMQVVTLPKIPRTTRRLYILFEFFRIGFIGFLILLTVKYLLFVSVLTVSQIFIFTVVSILLLFAFRDFAFSILKYYRAKGYNLHYAIVYADHFSDEVLETLFSKKEWGIKVLIVLTDSKLIKAKFGSQVKIISPKINVQVLLQNFVIDEVIYCKKDINQAEIYNLKKICQEIGTIFRLQAGLSPLQSGLNLEIPYQVPDLVYSKSSTGSIPLIIKSITDYYVAVLLLIILAPLFAILSLAVLIDSRGPVYFSQVRVGLRGRKFNLLKFRTMVKNAEEIRKNLEILNEMDGPVFKIKKDPRITRIGGFLRKTGLDELPQLINVLTGNMSLIGPRPPLPSEVATYEPWQFRRLSVKPGITCTWQVSPNRNNIKFEDWMKLDLKYIDNWNLLLDFQLFLKTIQSVLNRSGA
jgi:exopolysaccharide biosynthesis polyprenyl glycosylphosphotransferase